MRDTHAGGRSNSRCPDPGRGTSRQQMVASNASATAITAFLCPRCRMIRRYRAAKAVWDARVEANPASVSALGRHRFPLRTPPGRCLPALSFLPRQKPAQLAKSPALGKTRMSTPISARTTSWVRLFTPGGASRRRELLGEWSDDVVDLPTHRGDEFVQVVKMARAA